MSRLHELATRTPERQAYLGILSVVAVAVLIGMRFGERAAVVWCGIAFVWFTGCLCGIYLAQRERG